MVELINIDRVLAPLRLRKGQIRPSLYLSINKCLVLKEENNIKHQQIDRDEATDRTGILLQRLLKILQKQQHPKPSLYRYLRCNTFYVVC